MDWISCIFNNRLGVKLNDYYDEALIKELREQGVITENDRPIAAVQSRELPDYPSRAIWLDQKDFEHILDRHTDRFKIFGLPTDSEGSPFPRDIGNLIYQAFTKYPIVKTEEGRSPGAKFYIYAIRRPSGSGYLHVLVDQDGHIITAYSTRTLTSEQY